MAIGCDNASNMDLMLQKISDALVDQNIFFDVTDQRVRCLAHIINLAAKEALKKLYVSSLDEDEDDDVLEINDNLHNVIYKVSY